MTAQKGKEGYCAKEESNMHWGLRCAGPRRVLIRRKHRKDLATPLRGKKKQKVLKKNNLNGCAWGEAILKRMKWSLLLAAVEKNENGTLP